MVEEAHASRDGLKALLSRSRAAPKATSGMMASEPRVASVGRVASGVEESISPSDEPTTPSAREVAISAREAAISAREMASLRASTDEMEREMQQLRAKLGRQDASSRANVSG